MIEKRDESTMRELKRRALRWQKHRFPRKSPIPFSQKLLAWLMLILTAALVVVLIGQPAM